MRATHQLCVADTREEGGMAQSIITINAIDQAVAFDTATWPTWR